MNVRKGYSPEATTLCRLWLDNDEREYKFTQAVIAEAVRNREDREERIIMLAGRLEDFMKVNAPDLGGGQRLGGSHEQRDSVNRLLHACRPLFG